MTTFTIYAAMNRPIISLTLTRDGQPVDVTTATVKLYVRLYNNGARIVDGAEMSKDVAASGQVSYAFTALQTAAVGTYNGQAEITYEDSSVERTEPFTIKIEPSI
jgi:hypothetical protein